MFPTLYFFVTEYCTYGIYLQEYTIFVPICLTIYFFQV